MNKAELSFGLRSWLNRFSCSLKALVIGQSCTLQDSILLSAGRIPYHGTSLWVSRDVPLWGNAIPVENHCSSCCLCWECSVHPCLQNLLSCFLSELSWHVISFQRTWWTTIYKVPTQTTALSLFSSLPSFLAHSTLLVLSFSFSSMNCSSFI